MGKVKRRRSRHGKKKRVVEWDTSSSSEESDSGSETSEEELSRSKRNSRSKISKRPAISIIPDDLPPDFGNDDLYPGKETRFTDWDTSILLNLEVQRDLGLSQSDKDLWDSALEKMISLRNIYNERRRTGREDLEVRNLLARATVHKSVQTLNEVEDVGTQTFVDVVETEVEGRNGMDPVTFSSTGDQEGSDLLSDLSSSGISSSNKDTSNKEVADGNGEERQDTSSVPVICQIVKIETWDPARLGNVNLENAPNCSTHTLMEAAGKGLNETRNNLGTLNSSGDQEGAECRSSSHPSTSGKSTSNLDNMSNENLENGCESLDCHGESGGGNDGVNVKEVNEDNPECNDDGEKKLSSVTQPVKKKRGKMVMKRQTRSNTAKSTCLNSTSQKINPSSSQDPSTRLRKRKSSEPSTNREGHVKSKQPAIKELNRSHDDHESPSTSYNNYSMVDTPRKSEEPCKYGQHMLPLVPKCYRARELKIGRRCYLTEKEFVYSVGRKVTGKAIAICGSTGMGKTAFLAQIGRNILRTFPERKLFYLEIKNVADAVETEAEGKTAESELIWSAIRNLTRERKLGKANPNPKDPAYRTELFFDGFDNVQEEDWDLVCYILRFISDSFESTGIRIWVAAVSSNLSRIIDEILPDVSIYFIEPLDEATQVELIASYWERHTSECRPTLLEFARQCLRDLSSREECNLELGNPLQGLLIGAACLRGTDSTDSSYLSKPENILNLNIQENLLLDAAMKRSFHTLKLIVDLNRFNINSVNSYGDSALFLSVYAAGNVDCLLKLKLLLERKANLNHLNKKNGNLLMFAAGYASFESFSYILGLKHFNVNSADLVGKTPLFYSLFAIDNVDSLEKVKLLIENEANVDHVNNKNENLLLHAASFASLECLNHILSLKKFDINSVNNDGDTPLFNSVEGRCNLNRVNCPPKIKLLLDQNANLNYTNPDGTNLLNVAAQFASAEVLEFVLNEGQWSQCDINNEDKDGDTPLLVSVFQYEGINSLEKLKLLEQKGAKLDHANKNGKNLLHSAAQCGSLEVLEYVINMGKFGINNLDNFGRTALDYAEMDSKVFGVENVDKKSKINLLIKKGCKSKG